MLNTMTRYRLVPVVVGGVIMSTVAAPAWSADTLQAATDALVEAHADQADIEMELQILDDLVDQTVTAVDNLKAELIEAIQDSMDPTYGGVDYVEDVRGDLRSAYAQLGQLWFERSLQEAELEIVIGKIEVLIIVIGGFEDDGFTLCPALSDGQDPCLRDSRKVCGSDGDTYGNACEACDAGVGGWRECSIREDVKKPRVPVLRSREIEN